MDEKQIRELIKELKSEFYNYNFREPGIREFEEYLIFGTVGFRQERICPKCKNNSQTSLTIDTNTGTDTVNAVFNCICGYTYVFPAPYINQCLKYGNRDNSVKKSVEYEQYQEPSAFNYLGMIDSKRTAYEKTDNFRMDEFKEYLERKSKEFFELTFADKSNLVLAYKHRWTKAYQRGIMSKMYQLEAWFRRHGQQVGMISLTSAQTGYTDIEILNRFKESWSKFQDNLNKRGYQCFKLFEPHDSGVPHLHVCIIGDLSIGAMDELAHLWRDKYYMGDGLTDSNGKDHSFDFSLKEGIESLKNYLMKYLEKTIVSDITENEMLLRFHSMFWETGTHLYSCSRYLYFVMKKLKFKSNNPVINIRCGNKNIYNRSESQAYPCKYQQIEGIRYKYKLGCWERKSKFNFITGIDIMNNYTLYKIFNLWDNMLCDLENLRLLNL